jgi:hypothetical protein
VHADTSACPLPDNSGLPVSAIDVLIACKKPGPTSAQPIRSSGPTASNAAFPYSPRLCGGVEPDPAEIGRENTLAVRPIAEQAALAVPASLIGQNDVVSRRDGCHGLPDALDDPCALVAEDDRQGDRDFLVLDVGVRREGRPPVVTIRTRISSGLGSSSSSSSMEKGLPSSLTTAASIRIMRSFLNRLRGLRPRAGRSGRRS